MNLIKELQNTSLFLRFRKTAWWRNYLIKRGSIIRYDEAEKILNQAPPIIMSDLPEKPIVGIVQDCKLDIEGYVNPKASWLRYERFLRVNNIPYEFYDIYRSDWIEKAANFDIIVWHTPSNPSDQDIAESKIYVLENILKKKCFPSFHELWQYEDKCRANYLYQSLDIPSIPTIVTNSKEEALNIADRTSYPFITKTKIGASSSGVKIIKSKREAVRLINKIFDFGIKTSWKYQRHKDYFYYQEFISDAKYDLRIILVGNKAFGYYRYPKNGDFRASGAGLYEKKEIPKEALTLAIAVKDKLNSRLMGVDMLYSEKAQKYYIIETSLFNQIDTPEQLVIDGIPGYYDISDLNNIIFIEGKYWIQELILKEIVEDFHNKT